MYFASGLGIRLEFARPNECGGSDCLNRISAWISEAPAGLGCRAEGQRVEVGLVGRAALKRRMGWTAIVEVDEAAQRGTHRI